MIALDTNILLYANRSDLGPNNRAAVALETLVASGAPWAIPWPCIHEFLAVATNPRVFATPITLAQGSAYCQGLRDDAGARFLAESPQHLATLARIADGVTGARIHDARIAAICLDHGIEQLWTADRDFSYFPDLRTSNPLVG